MKLQEPVKTMVDYKMMVRARSDGLRLDSNSVTVGKGPFDRIAVEKAVRIENDDIATDPVSVPVSWSTSACHETRRTVRAIGADRAILVNVDALRQFEALADKMGAALVAAGRAALLFVKSDRLSCN